MLQKRINKHKKSMMLSKIILLIFLTSILVGCAQKAKAHPQLPPTPKIQFKYCNKGTRVLDARTGKESIVETEIKQVCMSIEDSKKLADYIFDLERACK